MKTYIFKGVEVTVKVNRSMLRSSIQLFDASTGSLVMNATEDAEELRGMPYYVAIKTEDYQILDFLVKNQIIAEPSTYLREGTVSLPICKLL